MSHVQTDVQRTAKASDFGRPVETKLPKNMRKVRQRLNFDLTLFAENCPHADKKNKRKLCGGINAILPFGGRTEEAHAGGIYASVWNEGVRLFA